MIPIISVVGVSDSGKTTLLEKVVKELRSRGWRIATVKHDVHSFEIDHEGKDSWRHKRAGANTTIISSPSRIAVVEDSDHDRTLNEIRDRFIRDVDVIITEGYKRETHPKIEVFRSELGRELLSTAEDYLIAIAGDYSSSPPGIPVFDLDDPKPLCDFIEGRFLCPR